MAARRNQASGKHRGKDSRYRDYPVLGAAEVAKAATFSLSRMSRKATLMVADPGRHLAGSKGFRRDNLLATCRGPRETPPELASTDRRTSFDTPTELGPAIPSLGAFAHFSDPG